MTETRLRRGRVHNAEGAREAILNAAEQAFSEHGFAGARIDNIAAEAGYNKGLIFRYFGDKLRLYLEVIRRVDSATRGMQSRALTALMEAGTLKDAQKATTVVETVIGEVFDYYLQNQRVLHIVQWEMAEGWQNYRQIAPQIDDPDSAMVQPLLAQLQEAGLLRSAFDPLAQIMMAIFQPILFLGILPIFSLFSAGEDTTETLKQARAFVMKFVAGGLMAGTSDTNSEIQSTMNEAKK